MQKFNSNIIKKIDSNYDHDDDIQFRENLFKVINHIQNCVR